MDVPKNCRECPHANNCQAWHYGSSKCAYKDKIQVIIGK